MSTELEPIDWDFISVARREAEYAKSRLKSDVYEALDMEHNALPPGDELDARVDAWLGAPSQPSPRRKRLYSRDPRAVVNALSDIVDLYGVYAQIGVSRRVNEQGRIHVEYRCTIEKLKGAPSGWGDILKRNGKADRAQEDSDDAYQCYGTGPTLALAIARALAHTSKD